MKEFYLIAGLGNPGPRYARNRHNIGFQTADTLAEKHGLRFSGSEHHAQTVHGEIAGYSVILAKPQTWMNLSGQAVAALAHFYKIPNARVLVIYDDLDIPLGTLRYRQDGSSGGHRGLDSTIQMLGSAAVPRLRLGIGRPPGQMDPADYVLQDFSSAETPRVWEVLRKAAELTVAWLHNAPDLARPGMTWRIEAP